MYSRLRPFLITLGLAASTTAQTAQFDTRSATGFPASPAYLTTLSFADVDGDGDLDAYACYSNRMASSSRVFTHVFYRGDGQGGFTIDATFPAQLPESMDSVFGDFDGDGDQDLVLAAAKGVYLENDGTGRFTDATVAKLPPSTEDSWSVASADLDGDNDLDLVMGELGLFNAGGAHCLRNDGTGKFSRAVQLSTSGTAGFYIGDINGDRRPDIVATTTIFYRPSLFVSTGAFTWANQTSTNWPTAPSSVRVAQIADWDSDGDLDLVSAPNSSAAMPVVYLNDGKGVLSTTFPMTNVTLRRPDGIAVFDADEDGDLDCVFGEFDGDAQFVVQLSSTSIATPSALGIGRINEVLAVDVDQDGDEDLVIDHLISPSPAKHELVLRLNHQRQIHADNDPMIGTTWQLDSWSLAPMSRYVVNFLSLDKLSKSIETPFGFLGLDPARSVALLPIDMSATATKATQTLAIPNSASLRGLKLHAQGLVIPRSMPTGSKLTNVWSTTIR